MKQPRVGILSLQGDFARHRTTLETLGVETVRVTLPRDLDGIEALVLPGGESTTMLRLLAATGLREPVQTFVRSKPALGTCAGVILLAREAGVLPAPTLAALDVVVERNAYGRQIDSFTEEVDVSVIAGPMHGVFIRAPRIRSVGAGVQVIARRRAQPDDAKGAEGEPIGVRQGAVVGICFHPELTTDLRFHRWFLTEVAGLSLSSVPAEFMMSHGARS